MGWFVGCIWPAGDRRFIRLETRPCCRNQRGLSVPMMDSQDVGHLVTAVQISSRCPLSPRSSPPPSSPPSYAGSRGGVQTTPSRSYQAQSRTTGSQVVLPPRSSAALTIFRQLPSALPRRIPLPSRPGRTVWRRRQNKRIARGIQPGSVPKSK